MIKTPGRGSALTEKEPTVFKVPIESFKGTLKIGDPFICGDYPGKVKAITNKISNSLMIRMSN